MILKNEEGSYDRIAYYHSKKDVDPIVVIKKDEYVADVVDDMIWNDEYVTASRNMLLMDSRRRWQLCSVMVVKGNRY